MSIFDWFRPGKRPTAKPAHQRASKVNIQQPIKKGTTQKPERKGPPENIDDLVLHDKDFLGMAARAGHKGIAAIKAKDFDTAWKYLNEQKGFYMQHANRAEFAPHQTIALDATVDENMANILRMEGKHREAFVHILYWVTASSSTKKQESKLLAYYRRAKFPDIGLMDIHQFIEENSAKPNYRNVQIAVKAWSETSKGNVSGGDIS